MSKKPKQHRHQNQGHTKSLLNPAAPRKNNLSGNKKSRIKGITGLVLLAVGLVAVGLVAYALNAPKTAKNAADTVSGSNPPLPTVSAPPPPPTLVSTTSANPSGARIQFATTTYDFGKLNGGESVKCAYVFTNVGDALLEISNVQTSCGCTTAGEWSRQVEPGKTGSIPIEFGSQNFSGQVSKNITVTCNDASQPVIPLEIKGTVWWAIEVTPQWAMLSVTAESPSNTTTVRIVNHTEQPLVLSPPVSGNAVFGVELKTNQPGKEYELVVRTLPPLPTNNVSGQITLKTSRTNQPVISVNAWVNVQPVLMGVPAQLFLPEAPLTNATPLTFVIRNLGTNTLTLSEPVLNAQGADVQIKELEPGRFFTVTLTFPAGSEIAPSEKVELNLKSNHPKFAMIKVPITQRPRPTPAAAPSPVPQPTLSRAEAPAK